MRPHTRDRLPEPNGQRTSGRKGLPRVGRHEPIRPSLDRIQNRVIIRYWIASTFTGRRHSERPPLARLFFRTELVPEEAPDEGARALRGVEVEDALVVVCRCRCERSDRGADCGALPRSRPAREAAARRRLLRDDSCGGKAAPEAHGSQSACYHLAMRAATKCRLPSRLPGDAVEAAAPFSSRFRMRSAARCPSPFFLVWPTQGSFPDPYRRGRRLSPK